MAYTLPRRLTTIALLLVSMLLPAAAGTVTITSLSTPLGTDNTEPFGPLGGFAAGTIWSGVGASVTNSPGGSVLGLFGDFACFKTCSETTFTVEFFGAGFQPGTTANLGLTGLATGVAGYNLEAYIYSGGNQSLGQLTGVANGSLNLSSTPIVILQPGNFSGLLVLTLQVFAGNLSIPAGTTADLFVTAPTSAVPEPGTLAIVVGALGLLVYVKRQRKA